MFQGNLGHLFLFFEMKLSIPFLAPIDQANIIGCKVIEK